MGRKRSSNSEESTQSPRSEFSETLSISSGTEGPPNKRQRKKYKKSHKHKLPEPEEFSEEDAIYIDGKRHRHKHKKHKKEMHKTKRENHEDPEVEPYRHYKRKHSRHLNSHGIKSKHRNEESDRERRPKRDSSRKRERYRESNENSSRSHSRDVVIKYEQDEAEAGAVGAEGRWNDDENDLRLFRNIKTEPLSDEEPFKDMSSDRDRKSNKTSFKKENNHIKEEKKPKKEEEENSKEKINFGLSGKLTEDTNTYNGIVIKYSQPPEARKPKRRWRWYIFKGEEDLPFLPLHRQSAYLIGRERKVADIPTDHPSCSKQHAVFQYRLVTYERPDGSTGRTVKPYILDLESANGTYVNNRRIEARRYVELMEKDVVKFGYSSREYVLLHEASKGSDDDMNDGGVDSVDLSPVSLLRSQ